MSVAESVSRFVDFVVVVTDNMPCLEAHCSQEELGAEIAFPNRGPHNRLITEQPQQPPPHAAPPEIGVDGQVSQSTVVRGAAGR